MKNLLLISSLFFANSAFAYRAVESVKCLKTNNDSYTFTQIDEGDQEAELVYDDGGAPVESTAFYSLDLGSFGSYEHYFIFDEGNSYIAVTATEIDGLRAGALNVSGKETRVVCDVKYK